MKTKNLLFILMLIGASYFSSFAQIGKCKGKYVGNIIAYSTPSNYTTLWNQVTSENGSKWGSIEGTKGSYNWSNSDLSYNWAKNNGGLFKFHTLMWGAQAPNWVSSTSSSEIKTRIEAWFKAVADHYGPMGGLKLIDVLNEPVNTAIATNLKDALTAGYKAEPANAGDLNNTYGWAIWPFQLARKNFPDAVLLINEFNIEMNWNNCRATYITMINAIKNAPNLTDGQKNLIDGVGLQAHGINNLTAANFKTCLDELWTKTGLPIHITEFDATADPNEAKQESVYSTLIPVAWEHAHVAGITFWGYIQGSTWINGNGVTGSGGTDSGIQYASGTDRPAFTWLKNYFASQPSLACCPAPAPFANCTTSGFPTVSISAPLNNATYTAPASVTITATANDADGTISKVEFYNGTTKLGEDVSSPYSYSWTNVAAGSYSLTAVATDNANNKTTSAAVTIKVNVPQGPYQGNAWPIPGTIQFEHYDVGGNGVAYNDGTAGSAVTPVVNFRTDEDVDIETCTDTDAGYNIGYATAGEWLEYTVNVTSAGTYKMDLRVACSGDARTLSVAMDGTNIATSVAIPNTAGWQTWQTVSINNITLTAGQKVMRVTIGATDYINLNYVAFTAISTNNPPVVSITAPLNNETFVSGSTIDLSATASDADGSITKVEFYQGTTLLGSDNTSPYTYTWTNAADGSYAITAKAYDDKNATTTSTVVSITVGNPVINLVTNPEFDNGTTGWSMQYNNSTAGTFAVVTNANLSGNNAAQVCPTTAGNADWNVQLRQDFPVTAGKTYEISFMAKAAATRTMTLAIQPDVDPYPIYFSQQINLTTTAQTYTYSFSATTTDAVAKLKFFLGNNTSCVSIDKVIVEESVVTDVKINEQETFSIYPNPADQSLTVIVSTPLNDQSSAVTEPFGNTQGPRSRSDLREIQIINIFGQLMYNSTFNIQHSTFSHDISQFPSGLYFIKFGDHVQKFIKQ